MSVAVITVYGVAYSFTVIRAKSQPAIKCSDRNRKMAAKLMMYYYNYNHLTASFPGQPG